MTRRRSCPEEHGTRSQYQRGCRCLPCASANAAYQAQVYQSRRCGRPRLGVRVPAYRSHVLMKLLRIEGFTAQQVDALLGWCGHYARIRKAKRVTLRTELQLRKLYRERCQGEVSDDAQQ